MADFLAATQKPGKGIHKSKKLSTRVDLTPMVDLGFLLITFFIFTTSMSEPKSLKLVMPDDHTKDSSQIADGATLQLLLGKDNKIWYYQGKHLENIQQTYYGNELRSVIIKKREFVQQNFKSAKEMMIIIKPTMGSSLRNIVSIMDEILINQIARYVITEPNEIELVKIQ